LSGACEQPVGDAIAGGLPDHLHVAADDQQVTGAGQPDVQDFLPPAGIAEVVDGEHHRGSFEPFESQGVAVEEVLAVPEGGRVRLRAVLLPGRLLRVPMSSGEQRDVLRGPAVLEQGDRLVVRYPGPTGSIRLVTPPVCTQP
jgi:hypothetical protein